MGRIKSALVKRTANKLIEKAEFSEHFENSKKLLVGTMASKRIRNMVAGYIARIKKRANIAQK